MLILTRRSGEAIDIGGEIQVRVLEVSGDHVRLGIEAPRHVRVLRGELREEVERENRLAAGFQGRLSIRPAGGLRVHGS